jgi:hypothetical protein
MRYFLCPLITLLLATDWLHAALPVAGQPQPQPQEIPDIKSEAHYSYAFYLGSGFYEAGEQTVAIFNIPFSYMFERENAELFTLRLPMSTGFFNFDTEDIKELEIPSRADTLAFALGAEKTWISDENWILTPYADLGYTWSDTTEERAMIYSVGARLDKHFVAFDRVHLWGNRVFVAGHRDLELHTQGSFVTWETGVDWQLPWSFRIGSVHFNTHSYAAVYWYLKPVQFIGADSEENTNISMEAGLTVSSPLLRHNPVLAIERLGFGVRAGQGVLAARFIMGMPF